MVDESDDINKHSIVIVDGAPLETAELVQALQSYYRLATFDTAPAALLYIRQSPPALLLIGERCPPTGPLELIRAVREPKQNHTDIPILLNVTAKGTLLLDEGKKVGASSYIVKPYRRSVLISTIQTLLNNSAEKEWETLPEVPKVALKKSVEIFGYIADSLGNGTAMDYDLVKESCNPLVMAVQNNDVVDMLQGVKKHDDYTYAHSLRVSTLLCLFGNYSRFSTDEQILLASGGLLHDVGKMTIPHEILNKPGRLSPEEFEIMKSHVPETMKYLNASGDVNKAIRIIAEQHHEKLNGTGYPNGLKAAELNELARMAAIVDVFSALTDRRVYKPSMEPDAAFKIMREEMQGHLDPVYINIFKKVLEDCGMLP
jgi:putative nucleotidyltransferase with HDIG domain